MLKIVFMGTPEFAVPILEALAKEYEVVLVVTQPDKKTGRKQEIVKSPVKLAAERLNLPIFQPEKIRNDYERIISLNPDLIVTAAYGQLIGTKVLNAPKYRSINVHGSLLPKYRGGSPIQTAIMNGDKETGITIMYMEKGMDSGDILAVRKCEIESTDDAGTLFNKLSIIGRDLLMEIIPLLVEGKIRGVKQDEKEVTYAYNITPEEEKIDFTTSAEAIVNKIRALSPAPLAYFNIVENDETSKLKIKKAIVSKTTHCGKVGKIIDVNKNYFTISCGNHTAIDVYEVLPFGKRLMNASDFINGGLKKYLK